MLGRLELLGNAQINGPLGSRHCGIARKIDDGPSAHRSGAHRDGFGPGGKNEARDLIVGPSCWSRGRQHRRSPRGGLLPVYQLSCRLHCATRRRAAAAAGRTCRGDSRRRCTGCRSTTRNANEPWWSCQSRGSAIRAFVPTSSAEPGCLLAFDNGFQTGQ